MELKAFAIIMTGVAFEVLAQVFFKRGASSILTGSSAQGILPYWRSLARDRWVQFGVAAQVAALLLWIAALGFAPLSIAYPLASLSYCGAALCGRYWLGETAGAHSGLALVLITLGAILVCWPSR